MVLLPATSRRVDWSELTQEFLNPVPLPNLLASHLALPDKIPFDFSSVSELRKRVLSIAVRDEVLRGFYLNLPFPLLSLFRSPSSQGLFLQPEPPLTSLPKIAVCLLSISDRVVLTSAGFRRVGPFLFFRRIYRAGLFARSPRQSF